MAALFHLGCLVATSGALALLRSAGEDLLPSLLERHRSGDWGEVPVEDIRENEFSVRHGFRISPLTGWQERGFGSSPNGTGAPPRCYCPRNTRAGCKADGPCVIMRA
jgi:hypothetical protein